jgi:hypothetical protein
MSPVLPLELGQVTDPYTRRALEQISLHWQTAGVAEPPSPAPESSGAFAFFNG